MPLIRNGEEVENTWLHVETGEAGDTPNGITVPLEAFLEKPRRCWRATPRSVCACNRMMIPTRWHHISTACR